MDGLDIQPNSVWPTTEGGKRQGLTPQPIATDGAFVHKSLSGDFAAYYFRSQMIIGEEPPYAILWELKRRTDGEP